MRLQLGAMFFVGEVLDSTASEARDYDGTPLLRYRVRVREPLYGTPPDLRELELLAGDYMERGRDGLYLFDLVRAKAANEPDAYRMMKCGLSGSVQDAETHVPLAFLRKVRDDPHATKAASLTVAVSSEFGSVNNHYVQGATVSIEGPVRRTAVADSVGEARFAGLPAGVYRASATHPAYTEAASAGTGNTVTVVSHGCAHKAVELAPALAVGGRTITLEGQPWPEVKLWLWSAERTGGRYAAISDEEGRFRFDAVRPGRYHLFTAGAEPKSYYPGRARREEATMIDAGAAVTENLLLPIRPTGARRTIRFRVVDQAGRPAVRAYIGDANFDLKLQQEGGYASIGETLRTGADGTASIELFENAHYQVHATNGRGLLNGNTGSRFADIPPGSGSVELRLQLLPQ